MRVSKSSSLEPSSIAEGDVVRKHLLIPQKRQQLKFRTITLAGLFVLKISSTASTRTVEMVKFLEQAQIHGSNAISASKSRYEANVEEMNSFQRLQQ